MQAGNFIYVSGQLPLDAATKEMVKDSIESATRKSLENCKAIVESAGATLNDVVKVEIFLKDMNEFAAMNGVYSEFFTDHKPARACVEAAMARESLLVEISVVAAQKD